MANANGARRHAAAASIRNALASSIILVCRPRAADAPTATRREFVTALKAELPVALAHLQRGNIAPVDLAQAAIGPGMAVYTRYAKVLDAEGKPLSVREALALINQTLDEALAEQEGDFDADSRWALAWFEQSGFAEGEYGVAETLSKAKNTSVAGMVEAGILASKGGKVRLLKPERTAGRLGPDDRPAAHGVGDGAPLDPRRWKPAAKALRRRWWPSSAPRPRSPASWPIVSTPSASARSAPAEALSYNGLVQSWPEITRLAREGGNGQPAQAAAVRSRSEPMAITNHERVGKALELLKGGLGPFVEREFKSAYKDRAAAEASRFMGEDRLNAKRASRRCGTRPRC